jgi:NAD/NADP transhydrogenase beta subunit
MAFYGVERKAAKMLVNRIMFGGGLAKWEAINECELNGMPEMVAFHHEFAGIRELVWDEFRKGDFSDKKSRHDKLSANMSA